MPRIQVASVLVCGVLICPVGCIRWLSLVVCVSHLGELNLLGIIHRTRPFRFAISECLAGFVCSTFRLSVRMRLFVPV